ncbi:LysR family transcriptional regulator [Caldinitratiruptor microaerophilus]|uniref:LysR family transcriptional regulator n=1 Tax=Caldinitratiruptor microaerophilus TaxID=671077 RepID=A0AA35CL61_9FIRM|nr:LysR family transcriptional regulator [Caldinitratiruptor microaerophilus]BDG60549.1 LysR family transcriptional regulator [Caldinitratiruptor microaerophilus]
MDLHHLQTFRHVARVLNFTRAAEDLSLSQSAVSRHIEALEAEFGLELFARSGRGVALTEAGLRLLDYADRIVRLSEEARRALGELKDLESGRLALGASTTPGNYVLGPVVARYQERYPGIDLRVEVRDTQSVLRRLEKGALDLAVVAGPVDQPGLQAEPCVGDELLLVAAPHHPLARRGTIRLQDLAGTRLFLREPGSNTRQAVEAHFRARGVPLGPTSELGSTEAIKRAVGAAGGVAFLSRYAVAADLAAGTLVALDGPDSRIPRQFVLAYLKGGRRPPAALAFAALLRKMRPALERATEPGGATEPLPGAGPARRAGCGEPATPA